MATGREIPIDTGATALEMANAIFGEGVTVVSATYSGDSRSSGIYSNGDVISPEITPADTGVMLSTGYLTDFTQRNGDPNRSGATSTNTSGPNNDALFNALAGTSTYDASILTTDIIPTGDTLTLQFVFSSEEYPEYAGSIYNDMIGVWVNGQPATMTIGSGNGSVGNINSASNENLYISNTNDQYNTEMDGFTVTMTVKMAVIPNVVNTIRIGIADVGDTSYDSTLLIAGNSGQTVVIASDDSLSIGLGGTKTIDVLANDSAPGNSTLTVTHINGQAVVAGDTITLATGQQITLNANGTFTVVNGTDIEAVNFSYTVATGNGNGASDSAFVTINSIPCFVAGTRISTPSGEVPVETLTPGDLVLTLDHGPQPVRWIGTRRVAAEGAFAPVRIAADTFGRHGTLHLSPLHRVLIRDGLAELLFGEPEVLVAAKNLVNDQSVRRIEGGEVVYVHILFDRHQVVFSEGLATESFLPGPHIVGGFEREIAEEILSLFPDLDPQTGLGYPAAARKMLKGYEARLLLPHGVAA